MTAIEPQMPTLSWQRRLLRRPARLLVRLLGWRIGPTPPPSIPKYVLIGAPHTSNWDSFFALTTTIALGVKINFLMKHTLLKTPAGPILRLLGGIPLDRTASMDMAQQILDAFARASSLIIAIAPEGTRSKVQFWKAGFYEIAEGAHVPIVLISVDYRRREVGYGPVVPVTGDIDADMSIIREFYSQMTAKYPENASPVRLRPYVARNRARAARQEADAQTPGSDAAPVTDDPESS